MRNSEPQRLNNLLKTSSLINIQEKSIVLTELNLLFYRFLPHILHRHCRVANYRQSILVIEVSSASWLTRLRYEQGTLLSKLRQNGLIGLASLQYKINPELNQEKYVLQNNYNNVNTTQRQISPQSAAILLALAQNTTPKLQACLVKLANHVIK